MRHDHHANLGTQIQQLGQTRDADSGVIFRDYAYVLIKLYELNTRPHQTNMLNHTVPKIVPALLAAHFIQLKIDGLHELPLEDFFNLGPAKQLVRCETLDQITVERQLCQFLVCKDFVDLVRLLVVKWRQHDKDDHILQHLFPLSLVALDCLGAIHLQKVFADIHIAIIVETKFHHEIKVAQLEVLQQSQLVSCDKGQMGYLVFLLIEKFGMYLAADDLSAHIVLLYQAEAHLFEDKVRLLPLIHRTKGLNLELMQNVSCLCDLALTFLELRKLARKTCALHFHKDLKLFRIQLPLMLGVTNLSLGDRSQSVNQSILDLQAWGLFHGGH